MQTDIEFWRKKCVSYLEKTCLREIEIGENPFPVKTEREMAVEEKDLPVFRKIFEKKPSAR